MSCTRNSSKDAAMHHASMHACCQLLSVLISLIRPKLLSEAQMNNRRPLVRTCIPASSSHFDTRAIFCRSRFSFSLAVAACRPYSSPTILLPILLLLTGGRGGRVRVGVGGSSAGTRHTCGASFASAFALGAAATNKRNMFRRSRAHTDPTRSIVCLLYTSPSPRDRQKSRMPSSA